MLELTVLPFNSVDRVIGLHNKPNYFRVVQPEGLISGTHVLINGKQYRVLSTSKFPNVSGCAGQLVVSCKPLKDSNA